LTGATTFTTLGAPGTPIFENDTGITGADAAIDAAVEIALDAALVVEEAVEDDDEPPLPFDSAGERFEEEAPFDAVEAEEECDSTTGSIVTAFMKVLSVSLLEDETVANWVSFNLTGMLAAPIWVEI